MTDTDPTELELREDDIDTEPPGPPSTAADHEIPKHGTLPSVRHSEPYSGEPAPAVLLRLEAALLGQDGELPKLRREMSGMQAQVNGVANAVERRRITDQANQEGMRTAVQNLGIAVGQLTSRLDTMEKRYDQRFDAVEERVTSLERRMDAAEQRANDG